MESTTRVAGHSLKGGVLSSLNERKAKIMAKKKNSRKALAVALGIMGIAGLSVASASQLNITASDNIATGTQTFGNSCDTAVSVAYTTATNATTGAVTYTGYTVSGIADLCVGKKLTATVGYSTYSGGTYTAAGTPLVATDQAIALASPSATDNNTVTVTFAPALAGSSRLDSIAITIK